MDWIINNKMSSPSVGNSLNGLTIQQVMGGYQLLCPDVRRNPLSSVNTSGEHFVFENVSWAGTTWQITVKKVPPGSDGHGSWITPAPPDMYGKDTLPQSGDFTAQAGVGLSEDEAASSAKA